MGKQQGEKSKNRLRKTVAKICKHRHSAKQNQCTKKAIKLPVKHFTLCKVYALIRIKYTIKFLHPKYIPTNDPRRGLYIRKLRLYNLRHSDRKTKKISKKEKRLEEIFA